MNFVEQLIHLQRKLEDYKINPDDLFVENELKGFRVFDTKNDLELVWSSNVGKEIAEFLGVHFEQ